MPGRRWGATRRAGGAGVAWPGTGVCPSPHTACVTVIRHLFAVKSEFASILAEDSRSCDT